MNNLKNKLGQMKMSFGMIFSIILIIIFLAIAFYGIKMFLGMQQDMQIKQFENDLQGHVDKMWKSTKGSQEQEYVLPKKIKQVCFEDEGDENLFYDSNDFIEPAKINHINITKIIGNENSYCIKNTDGKIKLTIKKDYGELLVVITK